MSIAWNKISKERKERMELAFEQLHLVDLMVDQQLNAIDTADERPVGFQDLYSAAVQPEVRVHLRVHPHFVAHVPAHRCRSMVAVDGDRETLRTDLQRIKMPTASEASASVHMLAGGAARIISNDRRSRVRCA